MEKNLREIIKKNLQKIKKTRVLCLGDLVIDRYIYGTVHRISPEAPIPILSYEKEAYGLGGVGNVAKNILSLGANVTMIYIGDNKKKDIKKINQLQKYKKNLKSISIKNKGYFVPKKIRFVDKKKHLLRLDHELNNFKLSHQANSKILEIFEKEIKKCDIVLLSDYGKGFFGKILFSNLIKKTKKNNKIIIIDPKQKNFNLYKGADIVTPNLHELSIASNNFNLSQNEKKIINAARKIIKKNKISEILVTRSEKGMTLVTDQNHKNFYATTKKAEDVTGAGDTVVASLALMKAIGIDTEKSVKIANYAAGKVVQKIEAASLTLNELIN